VHNSRESSDDTVLLHEGDGEEQWLVGQRDVPVTNAMRKDAGADAITLWWRDYADLPPITRPRASVALLCPMAP
jgi:hypothetical protein